MKFQKRRTASRGSCHWFPHTFLSSVPLLEPVGEDVDYGAITGIHIGEMSNTQSLPVQQGHIELNPCLRSPTDNWTRIRTDFDAVSEYQKEGTTKQAKQSKLGWISNQHCVNTEPKIWDFQLFCCVSHWPSEMISSGGLCLTFDSGFT